MLDFVSIATRTKKPGFTEVYPKFLVKKSDDLLIRGGDFYAVWVEDRGLWSTDEYDVIQLVDRELTKYAEEKRSTTEGNLKVCYMWDAESGMIDSWHKYCQKQLRDTRNIQLDEKLVFANDGVNKKDYATKRLSYPLESGEYPAWEKIISTLYTPEERHKLEWAIGSIVTGDSKFLQKFLVLYGGPGTGKSTILNIIQELFDGYHTVFDAKALGSANAQFALEPFKDNPLVAIQHDGDLSKIEDNTRLNSVVSHELMTVNEKHKSMYKNRFVCFLFMGTNKPVKITDGKSGILRRLIDVTPSGNKLNPREYKKLMKQVKFELGPIAYHCKEVYLADPGAYDDYIPISMMGASNDFYNFMIDSYHVFLREDGTSLKAAWEMYKTYVEEAKVPYSMSKMHFKSELMNYFREYNDRFVLDGGDRARSYYSGFRTEKFENGESKNVVKLTEVNDSDKPDSEESHIPDWLKMDAAESIFDKECADCFAQRASSKETPARAWDDVRTTLAQINTSKLHYVKVPENHIVIDFDIKDESGNKSFEKNMEAAKEWPPTYAELSKSGAGIHLHYIYTGDVTKLSRIYDEDVEVKVFTGKSSLRRMLTKCNDQPIATICSGLPLKGDEGRLINWDGIKNEKMLRNMIRRNLAKEYHSYTKPSVDYIYNLLEDAYARGIGYDVSDLKNDIFAFAAGSTNSSAECIRLFNKMKFKSEEPSENVEAGGDELVFYDVEVFKNLFLVNWKVAGEGKPVVRMINPKPHEIEELLKFKLVGFNCRRYDNHILYSCLMGYTNEQIYNLSKKIINAEKGEKNNAFFREAYNLSYTDVYDFAAKKQSLKKWEIELGIGHKELGMDWDAEVPEERWEEVAQYCDADVLATEAVFNYLKGDWTARQILADLAGGSVNDTTNSLTTKIVFGKERKPNLVYTDLSTGEQFGEPKSDPKIINKFEGYEFIEFGEDKQRHNMYRGTDIGFGGYIVSFPGIYTNVALLDVASLHPNSIRAMNCFGEYTKNFTDILDARVAIKHGDYDSARKMLNGRLAPYLEDESTAKDLAQALKIAINSVYGLTAASFDNPFRDIRNKNNIVALRGALTLRTLQDEVTKRGYPIVAIKTDSIKIANADKEIIDFCMDFAKKYSYQFEHEATYDRICQINDADYIAKYADPEYCESVYGYVPGDNAKAAKKNQPWTATGKQFQIPYVFKSLFSKEPIEFEDYCEAKEVKTAIYLDMNENLPDGEHDYHFVGKVGNFCPIKPGADGGVLVKTKKTDDGETKYDSVTGTLKPDKTPYRWLEAETVKVLGKEDCIDKAYHRTLVDKAVGFISQYGDFERFVADEPYITTEIPDFPPDEDLPYYIGPELDEFLDKMERDREDANRPPWCTEEEWAAIREEENIGDAFKKR